MSTVMLKDDFNVSDEFIEELSKLGSIKGYGLNEVSVYAQMLYSVIKNKINEKRSRKKFYINVGGLV